MAQPTDPDPNPDPGSRQRLARTSALGQRTAALFGLAALCVPGGAHSRPHHRSLTAARSLHVVRALPTRETATRSPRACASAAQARAAHPVSIPPSFCVAGRGAGAGPAHNTFCRQQISGCARVSCVVCRVSCVVCVGRWLRPECYAARRPRADPCAQVSRTRTHSGTGRRSDACAGAVPRHRAARAGRSSEGCAAGPRPLPAPRESARERAREHKSAPACHPR